MNCQSTSNIKAYHKIDKNNKDERCKKKKPLLNKILGEIPYNLKTIIRKEINSNKHRQIRLLMPKGSQVFQITIDKINLTNVTSGITHSQDQ